MPALQNTLRKWKKISHRVQIFVIHMSDKGFISRIYKEFL